MCILDRMSFALEFLSPGGIPPTFEQIEEWRLEIPQFEASTDRDGLRTWWYRNHDTGVYFVLSLYEVRPSDDDALGPCGLEASINHLRPSFFALEAAPILGSLAQCLALVPSDGATGTPLQSPPGTQALCEEMITLWSHGNMVAMDEAMESGRKLHLLDPQSTRRWWEYSRRRQAIQQQLQNTKIQAEVPQVHFLKIPASGKVVTAMAWENDGACVFPPCDYVVLDRTIETRKFLRKVSERKVSYLSTELFMKQVAAALRPIEVDGMSFRLLTAENAWRAAERIPNLPVEEDLSEFKPLRPDQILDEEP